MSKKRLRKTCFNRSEVLEELALDSDSGDGVCDSDGEWMGCADSDREWMGCADSDGEWMGCVTVTGSGWGV